MITYIAVDKPISTIQLDIKTSVQPQAAPGLPKDLSCKQGPIDIVIPPIPSGWWRCLLFRMNQEIVSGRIIDVPGSVTGIANIVAASADGTAVSVIVGQISQPQQIKTTLQIQ